MKIFTLAHLLALLAATQLNAQTSFFEGKTIRIIVGLPAGDAYDIYARHIGNLHGQAYSWQSQYSWFKICRVRRA